jgi:hypothetical protein
MAAGALPPHGRVAVDVNFLEELAASALRDAPEFLQSLHRRRRRKRIGEVDFHVASARDFDASRRKRALDKGLQLISSKELLERGNANQADAFLLAPLGLVCVPKLLAMELGCSPESIDHLVMLNAVVLEREAQFFAVSVELQRPAGLRKPDPRWANSWKLSTK